MNSGYRFCKLKLSEYDFKQDENKLLVEINELKKDYKATKMDNSVESDSDESREMGEI